jgi:polyferredoxin
MAQVGRPLRLIDYVTLEGCEREKAGKPAESVVKTILRTRTLIYLGAWSAIGCVLLFALGTREHIAISVAKDRNPPFMPMSDGSVRNAYTVKLRNMESRPRPMEIALDGLPGATMWSDDMPRSSAGRTVRQAVAADQADPVRIYVIAPPGTHGQDFRFTVRALDAEGGADSRKTHFDTPGEAE